MIQKARHQDEDELLIIDESIIQLKWSRWEHTGKNKHQLRLEVVKRPAVIWWTETLRGYYSSFHPNCPNCPIKSTLISPFRISLCDMYFGGRNFFCFKNVTHKQTNRLIKLHVVQFHNHLFNIKFHIWSKMVANFQPYTTARFCEKSKPFIHFSS